MYRTDIGRRFEAATGIRQTRQGLYERRTYLHDFALHSVKPPNIRDIIRKMIRASDIHTTASCDSEQAKDGQEQKVETERGEEMNNVCTRGERRNRQ